MSAGSAAARLHETECGLCRSTGTVTVASDLVAAPCSPGLLLPDGWRQFTVGWADQEGDHGTIWIDLCPGCQAAMTLADCIISAG
jgi:hypothetical protein